MADKLPALYAAVALDPNTKLKYFEIEWADRPEWVTLARTKSKELWERQYRTLQYVETANTAEFDPSSAVSYEDMPEDTLSR